MVRGGGRVVFVEGVAHSGSTALDFVLGNRPDSMSLGEIAAWYRPSRDHHVHPDCNCGSPVDHCEFWGHLGKPRRRHLYRDVLQAGAYDYVIDSSKHHAWLIDGLRACHRDGLQTRVLMSWRPPIHVTYSAWKRGLTAAPTATLLANVHHLNSLGVPYLPVRYDELVADAPGTIAAVYDYIGGAYRDGQERFWEGSFHSFFGAEFTRKQLGQQSEFASPMLPDEFLEFWDRVPAEDKRAMQRLDDEMHAPHTAHRRVRRRPWYWKSRALAVRNRAAARRRVRSPSPA